MTVLNLCSVGDVTVIIQHILQGHRVYIRIISGHSSLPFLQFYPALKQLPFPGIGMRSKGSSKWVRGHSKKSQYTYFFPLVNMC